MNTSLEQSKKLVELGIDINTADMFYADILVNDEHKYIIHPLESYGFKTFKDTKGRESNKLKFIPAWSLSALLDLLPKGEDNNIDLCFGGYNGEEYIDEWFCTFEDNKEPFEFHTCNNKDKLDAVFEMIVYLKENNKL